MATWQFVKQNIEAALKKNEVEFEIKVHRVLYSSCMDGQWIESAKLKALAAQEHPPPPPDDSSYQNATHSHTKSHRHSSRTNSDALAVADDDDDSSSCYAFASSGRGSYRSSSWRAGSSSATNGNGTGSGKLQHWRRSHAKKHGNKKNRRLSSIVVDR
uniref:Uncharacterized protein n=1 Tax=Lotharella globosa TaxID=91324 RepID=A0A7S3YL95_9EUKA